MLAHEVFIGRDILFSFFFFLGRCFGRSFLLRLSKRREGQSQTGCDKRSSSNKKSSAWCFHLESSMNMRAADRPESHKHYKPRRVLSVNGSEKSGFAVQRELSAQGSRNAGNQRKVVIISKRVRLNASQKTFFEAGRLGIFTQQQLVCAIHVFNAGPNVVAFGKVQCGFCQITAEHLSRLRHPIPSPQQCGSPASLRQRTAVHQRSSHSLDIFRRMQLLRTAEVRERVLRAPVLPWLRCKPC